MNKIKVGDIVRFKEEYHSHLSNIICNFEEECGNHFKVLYQNRWNKYEFFIQSYPGRRGMWVLGQYLQL
jgi:hypothetical protein